MNNQEITNEEISLKNAFSVLHRVTCHGLEREKNGTKADAVGGKHRERERKKDRAASCEQLCLLLVSAITQ